MKNLTKWFIYMVPVIALATILSSCDKDDDDEKVEPQEEQNDYYGNWESNPYLSMNQVTWEKMVFSFTNTTFEDKVYQGANAESLTLTVGMKGTVDNSEEDELDVEIMEIAAFGGSYAHKEEDSAAFYPVFNGTLGQLLDEEFVAEYAVDGESMQLILPIKIPNTAFTTTDTLNLTKMAE